MTIRIAINQNHSGKMPDVPPQERQKWWREFNGGFTNFNLPSLDTLVWAIQMGYSYTAQHGSYRKRDNFIGGQHIGLDYDTEDYRSDIGYLANIPFVKRHAALIHTTASHTSENPRARVIFLLEESLTDAAEYTATTEAFANRFSDEGGADPSCRDPVRLFFGAEQCNVIKLDNRLNAATRRSVIANYSRAPKPETPRVFNRATIGGAGHAVAFHLERLHLAPDGEKYYTLIKISRLLGGYAAAGYLTMAEARQHLIDAVASRADDLDLAKNTIDWALKNGSASPVYLEEDVDPIYASLFE